MHHPVPLEGPSGAPAAPQAPPPTDFAALLPGNVGSFLNGIIDGAERGAGIDRERVEALVRDMIAEGGPWPLYSYYLGGMGLSISAVVQSIQMLLDEASDLTWEAIARFFTELPEQVLEALEKAKRLLADPALAGVARELGEAIGESMGREIDFGATSARHFMQQLGRLAGTILIEVWISAVTGGVGNALLKTRWGGRLVEVARSVWRRIDRLPGDRPHAPRMPDADRGTGVNARGAGDKGLDGGGVGEARGRPARQAVDEEDELAAWERDFKDRIAEGHVEDPEPEVARPQRYRSGEDREDIPPPHARFGDSLDFFTDLLQGRFGEEARHPTKWKKDGSYTKHFEDWTDAVEELKSLRQEMLELIEPGMVLDPANPRHRELLKEIAEVRSRARDSAGKKYGVFQSRFWRQAWDNEWVRAKLLKPAFEDGSPFLERVAGRSAKALWEDDELRSAVLERYWGVRWLARGQAPKSRVVRMKGPDVELVEWVPLELDHLVRQADNPFLALDNRNLNVTTSLHNQRMMEGIRRVARGATSDQGAFEYGGMSATSGADRDIEQFLLANREGLKAVAEGE